MGAEQSTQAGAVASDVDDDRPKTYPSALVITGPSGVGKGTLIRKLMELDGQHYGFSCSHTTRDPRPGEKEGVDYFYVTREQFDADCKEGKFLEHATVHNNCYGTSIASVAQVAQSGRCCILDLDTQGARQIRDAGLRAIFVFIAPPSTEELENRLRGRGTESEEQVQRRLQAALNEMEAAKEPNLFDYVLVNDDVEKTAAQLVRIGHRALAGELGAEVHEEAGVDVVHNKDTQVKTEPPAPTANGIHHQVEDQQPSTGDSIPSSDTPKPVYLGTYEQHRDKIAVVTGASTFAGAALCRALALAGLRVVALAKTRESLQTLQRELILEAGVSAANFLPIVCDTTKEAELVAVPRIVAKRWPETGIDILVHIEDVEGTAGNLIDGNADTWRESMLETMLSFSLCCREMVQDMATRKSYGYVINIVSEPSTDAAPSFHQALLSCCRTAVQSLTAAVFAEVKGQNLPIPVCNVVYGPSTVRTTAHVGDRTVQFSKASQNLQADILEAVAWCLIN